MAVGDNQGAQILLFKSILLSIVLRFGIRLVVKFFSVWKSLNWIKRMVYSAHFLCYFEIIWTVKARSFLWICIHICRSFLKYFSKTSISMPVIRWKILKWSVEVHDINIFAWVMDILLEILIDYMGSFFEFLERLDQIFMCIGLPSLKACLLVCLCLNNLVILPFHFQCGSPHSLCLCIFYF